MSDKLREALEACVQLLEHLEPEVRGGYSPDGALAKAHEALAEDDAARGTMREEFEAWSGPHFMSRNNVPGSDLDGYQDPHTQAKWGAWQASRAAAPHSVEPGEFCWLVELFEGDGTSNSAGWYHTGFVDIGGHSRTTKKPHEARRYTTKEQAECVAEKLGTTLTGTWKAAEHGFAAAPQSAERVCRDDGRCQYAIDHGAEGLGHCPKGKCAMPTAPTDAEWAKQAYEMADALRAHLSTRPQHAVLTAVDRLDAERYRWLRDVGDSTWASMGSRVDGGGPVIDKAIDAAMSAPPTKTKEPGV